MDEWTELHLSIATVLQLMSLNKNKSTWSGYDKLEN